MEVLVERWAGVDVGKGQSEGLCTVPGPRGGRRQQIRTFSTITAGRCGCGNIWSRNGSRWWGWRRPTPWKPVYYLIEDVVEVQLLDGALMLNVPGRKTDVTD